MKITLQHFFAIILLTLSISCSVFRPVDMTKVSIGMTKAEVETALKLKPHALLSAGRIDGTNDIAEDIEYTDNYQQYRYVLTFVNDKLQSWHTHRVHNMTGTAIQTGK